MEKQHSVPNILKWRQMLLGSYALTYLLTSLCLYPFTICKCIVYYRHCRDGIYFDKILVSEYKLLKRSNKANHLIALVQQPVSQIKMTFQKIRIIVTGPCIANQLRDVNTICKRGWYIAAHIWKIYDFKIEVYHKFQH